MSAAEVLSTQAVDDADLVARATAGDEHAFSTLYRRHVRYVAGVVFRILRNDADLNDVLQQAFSQAFVRLPQLRDPAGFRSWVTRIAVRRSQDCLLSRKRQERVSAEQSEVATVTTHPTEAEDVEELYRAMERLSPRLRVPWALHYLEGETIEETARLCDVSLSTVKRRVSDAQDLLTRWLSVES